MESYAGVVVDLPLKKIDRPFDYKIPERLLGKIQIGSHVLVPFGHRKIEGFVVELKEEPEVKQTREIYRLLHDYPLFDEKMLQLMKWISDYYQAVLINVIKTAIPTGIIGNKVRVKTRRLVRPNITQKEGLLWIEKYKKRAPKQAEMLSFLLKHPNLKLTAADLARKFKTNHGTVKSLEEKGLITYEEIAIQRNPYDAQEYKPGKPLRPTFHQYKAITRIIEAMEKRPGKTILLKGVTGSGKTEVYLQVIAKALEKGKDTIVLVPEIALTPQTVERFKSRFGANVAVLHSQLSLGERFDEWRRIYQGEVKIVVGARSAIFAPFQNLGLIIIDEEHETSYKQTDQVKYHARDVAIKRAKLSGAVTVLGSATPAVESFYRAVIGEYELITLPERVNLSPLPPVEIIDMRRELKNGNRTIFSKRLNEAIEKRLSEKKQVILFLNRRGFSNFVLCRECGYVIRCQYCDVSLTYHADINLLQCHYCDYHESPPHLCPNCGSKYIKYFGIGTQQVEEFTRKQFPYARVARMDVDTTRQKGAHDRILKAFREKKIDILIGTQMITKGHDFPDVTLVGVVIADTALYFPDFRSGERTFQLLTQVAGRTGRGEEQGEVIIQTYSPEHYSIKAAKNHDYDLFFHEEIGFRKEILHPPFSQLINIIIQDEVEKLVIEEAHRLANLFTKRIGPDVPIEVSGPAPAPLARVRGKYRWQIILRSREGELLRRICQEVMKIYYNEQKSSVVVSVDVDPIGIL
ncbi:primosomal protein N' [Anoxybacter fermentans]|uniref:Replication restart protein PriA n=1 Tax=Anoxybacter fermentans TaxID=1323375 RepID=A0A3S9SXA5_9FIRM|nr:primosomal protein N' [Anoxybacter fermentans]AZR72967.1 primosomal protein N' [Anoxybacter fermentans]